jgi:membrane protease YdiL (CAAX protease family)
VSVLTNILFCLFALGGVYVYIALVRQISVRSLSPLEGAPPERTFGVPEAIVAVLLISFLLLNVVASIAASNPADNNVLSSRDLAANLVLTVVVLLILIGFLKLRHLDVERLAGLSKTSLGRSIATGTLLLLAAYPLISLADAITRRFEGSGSSKQNIVELFNGSRTLDQRMMIIVLAVAIAPIAEEFIFRFFLYGVLRRYLGRFAGLTLTSLLFAAVHAHLPSFLPLFVLGACFTIAYEWSGSLFVSMTMHSLFNSMTLIFLAFPRLSEQ